MTPDGSGGEAGFTLVELMVSLALFALIGVAGLMLVSGVLDAHRRSQSRLARLADLQRAVYVLDADITQIAPGPIVEDARGIAFARHAAGGDVSVRYALAGGTLRRFVGGREQALLPGVVRAALHFRRAGEDWRDRWPPSAELADRWPAAIAIDLELAPGAGPTGTLRRVIDLPAQP